MKTLNATKKCQRNSIVKKLFFLFLFALFAGRPFSLFAQNEQFSGISFNTPLLLVPYCETAPEITSRSAVLFDYATGTVLYSKNPHLEIPPASLTKLMTMHLLQKEIDAGRASLDAIVPIGEESWARNQPLGSSLMFLAPGQIVTLRELMLGLAVSSGNDAAVAAALFLAPSVQDFAKLMNREARRLGLEKTSFVEPSGISEYNRTTAAEFAVFCREYLRQHPKSLADFHSVPEFSFPKVSNVAPALQNNVNSIRQANRNTLLKTFPGVDGMKTGFIEESGYNIALTAQRDNTRFITVLLGAPADPGGDRIRDRDAQQLLNWAFANFKTAHVNIGNIKPARLWKGRTQAAELQPAEALSFTAPVNRARVGSLKYKIWINDPVIAPLPAFSPVGWLTVFDDYGEVRRVALVTKEEYPQGNIFRRIWDSIVLFFTYLF
ncbi:MAG: D-alanyl-D-alanine carboxypeptidase [Treponema sp.]|nr:D-alanyl-D-alanine carboxypeptidase [Treponema sp.]